MKSKYLLTELLLLLVFVSYLGVIGCSSSSKKIPITTSSKEAKELYLKGLSLIDRLRAQEANRFFEDAIALDSNFAMAYLYLATTQQSATEFYQYFNKVIELKEDVSKGEQLWIEAFEAGVNNQPEEQVNVLKELTAMFPKDERAINFLGTSYFGQQDYPQAIEYYLEALNLNPDFSPVYNQLGYSYRFLKNYTAAEDMFQKYIELIPNDPNPYDSYAELLLEAGKFDESIANYEKALKINPNFVISYNGIATNLNLKGQHVQARNRLHELLEAARDNNQRRIAYNGKAISYIDEGNYEAALKEFNQMLQNDSLLGDTALMAGDYMILGVVYREMGNLDRADECFERALSLSSVSSLADQVKQNIRYNLIINRAQNEIKRGNIDSAKANVAEYRLYAEEQNNSNFKRFANQVEGLIALAEENFELANEFFRNSNQQNPYNLYRIGLAYEGLNDTERATSFFTKAAEANSLSNINYAFIRKKAIEKAGL